METQQLNLEKYGDEITQMFPPVCPHCGAGMGWSSDFMTSEIGYTEDGDEENDRIVHVFSCMECDATADYEDLEDEGRMALLSVCLNHEDDEEETEPDLQYSQYAQDKYGMPPFID